MASQKIPKDATIEFMNLFSDRERAALRELDRPAISSDSFYGSSVNDILSRPSSFQPLTQEENEVSFAAICCRCIKWHNLPVEIQKKRIRQWLVVKERKPQKNREHEWYIPRFKWKCCGDQTISHTGKHAKYCPIIHNDEPIDQELLVSALPESQSQLVARYIEQKEKAIDRREPAKPYVSFEEKQ